MTSYNKRLCVLAGTLFLVPHILVGCMDTTTVERARACNIQLLDKPIISAIRSDSRGEDPDEDAKITAALVEQGYFREDVPLSFALQDVLHTACDHHCVDYAVALGLIEVESGFKLEAVNPVSGCYGLTQLNPKWFPSGLSPEENIEAGIAYLGVLLERYGDDVAAALTSYNAGRDTGNREYANAVLAAAEEWRKL